MAWGFGVRREIDLGEFGGGGNDGDDATEEEEEEVVFGFVWSGLGLGLWVG